MFKTIQALWFFFCFAASSFASELEILAVEEPPSSYVNSNGQLAGFSVEVVQAIQERVGDKTPIRIVPEARALLKGLEKPNVLLFAFSRTPLREDKFHWISLLLRKPWVLYGKTARGLSMNNLDQAKAMSGIGVVIGDVREQYLSDMAFTNLSRTMSHQQNLRMLLLDRVDLVFYEPLGMAYLCKQLDIPLSSIKPVFTPERSDVYLMMSKNNTSMKKVTQWREAAKAIKEDGTFLAIAQKWSGLIMQETGLSYGYKEGALDLLE